MRNLLIGATWTSLALALALACVPAGGSVGEPPGAAASADRKLTIQNANMPRTGDRAPVLEIEETLGDVGRGDGDWTRLKGKATVLEFWATWCGPCVQAIPHLNELADDLAEHDIRFVSITDEEEGTVAPFLEANPISGLVALDLDGSVFEEYGIRSIPTTFLVDRKGVVQAVTRAGDVTREALLDLMAGRRPDVPELEDLDLGELFEVGDEGPEAVFQVLVRPSTKREGGMERSPGKVTMIAFEPETMLKVAYNVGEGGRLLMEAELPDRKYDVVVNTGGRPELLEPMFQQAVSAALGVEATWEERVVEAQVLVATAEPKLEPLGPPDNRFYVSRGLNWLGTSHVGGLVDTVASRLKQPVIDETGLTGRYKIHLEFDLEEDPESLARAIEENLGLALVPEERTVEMLVVRKH
ncbi:MAG: TIGR03435 family protein [Acidobacteria bacterium]|nr:TIGR03435 family protein [Acidobacteriota bacterium]